MSPNPVKLTVINVDERNNKFIEKITSVASKVPVERHIALNSIKLTK